MGLFLSLFHPSDMFQKSVRCYLILGAFLIWVPYGGFLWERFLLVGSFGKGVFWKRVLWKGNHNYVPSFLILLCVGAKCCPIDLSSDLDVLERSSSFK